MSWHQSSELVAAWDRLLLSCQVHEGCSLSSPADPQLLASRMSVWLLQAATVVACHSCSAPYIKLHTLRTACGCADDEFCRTFAAKIVSSVCKRSTSVLAECGLELQMLADLVRDHTCSAVTKQLLVYALVRVRPLVTLHPKT